MRPLTVALVVPTLLVFLSANVEGQSAPSLDVKGMLAGLQEIKQKQADSAKSQLERTIADFSAAAADDGAAFNFYAGAVWVTRFVGQPHEQTAFRNWKEGEALKIKPSAVRTALRYTTLTLQRAAGATDDQIFPPLLAYAEDTLPILPTIEDQEIVRTPVGGNIFAKWYNIGDKLSALENWESSPANIDGMYEKILLPVMRRNHDPRILRYWDNKLATETAAASAATAAFSTDRFNQTRRPELIWSRAEDEIAIGMRDQGITEMYNLVKLYPSHPNAGKWIDELEGILAPAAPAPAAGGSPAVAPATGQ